MVARFSVGKLAQAFEKNQNEIEEWLAQYRVKGYIEPESYSKRLHREFNEPL